VNAIIRRVVRFNVAATFVALTVVPITADVCVYKPPKVQRICGVIVDPQGAAVPGVQVTIFRGADVIAASTTADAGEFNFEVMEPGKYDLDVTARGFKPARYHLTLLNPTKSCSNALRVEMEAGSVHCAGDTFRETKKPLGRK